MNTKMNDDSYPQDTWEAEALQDRIVRMSDRGYNFLEITKLPKKIDGRSLTSLIVSASKIIPKSTEICIKESTRFEQVAIVEFGSEVDAIRATERVKSSAYGKFWNIKIIKNPKNTLPQQELLRQLFK